MIFDLFSDHIICDIIHTVYATVFMIVIIYVSICWLFHIGYLKTNNCEKIILVPYANSSSRIKKGTRISCGIDVSSIINIKIEPGERSLVNTGLKICNCPETVYLRAAPRSSLAIKGIDIGAGVIDADYRGEIKLLVINNSQNVFEINCEDYIGQLIPTMIFEGPIYYQDKEINSNKQRQGGFGSTNNEITEF